MLSKPLVKLLSIQQAGNNSNSGVVIIAIGEFMQDMEQVLLFFDLGIIIFDLGIIVF